MQIWIRHLLPSLIFGVLGSLVHTAHAANTPSGAAEVEQLLTLDINRLLDIEVTLTSRVAESAFDAAAAIYVLTREDIQRSGHRRLVELLRMVPGLHVGKWDSNKWAVSSRNALSRFSSTMLVMIDGRHVYTPLYGGVRWEIQDVMLEDVERIEIIRGPGGPLWGANAVDGIVNVITRNARETQGALSYAGIGSGEMRYEAGARVGGKTEGDLHYRIFAKTWQSDVGSYLPRDQSTHNGRREPGNSANDRGESWMIGMRSDWGRQEGDSFSLQANAFNSRFNEDRTSATQVTPNSIDYQGINAMLHWRRQLNGRDSIELRTSLDRVDLADDILIEKQTLFDVDFQHNLNFQSQQLTWGLGYRYYRSDTRVPPNIVCNACFGVSPQIGTNQVYSAFIQDQISLSERWLLTLGSKFESSNYAPFEFQPTLRLAWKPDEKQTLWAAKTRAVRTPTRLDRDQAFFNVLPAQANAFGCVSYVNGVCQLGNSNAQPWIVQTYEAGYRLRPNARWGIDLTAFQSNYHNTVQKSAIGRYEVHGVEGVVRFQPSPHWQIETNYTWAVSRDIRNNGSINETPLLPARTAHLRSLFNLSETVQIDTLLYYVSELKRSTGAPLPAYTRLDLRLGWKPRKNTDVSLWLTNLTDGAHPEYIEGLKVNTAVRRGALLKLTLEF